MELILRRSFYCLNLIAVSVVVAAFIYLTYQFMFMLIANWGNWVVLLN